MGFDSPFGPEDLFHFRIGKFAPNVVDGFQEMWISTDAAHRLAVRLQPDWAATAAPAWRGDVDADADFAAGIAARHRRLRHHQAIARCGWRASPTASGRARPTRPAASTATTRKTSTRGSTTRSAAWGSTATPAAQPSGEELARQLAARRRVHLPRRRATTSTSRSATEDGKIQHPGPSLPAHRHLRQPVLPGPECVRRLPARHRLAAGVRRRHGALLERVEPDLSRVVHAGRLRDLSRGCRPHSGTKL